MQKSVSFHEAQHAGFRLQCKLCKFYSCRINTFEAHLRAEHKTSATPEA